MDDQITKYLTFFIIRNINRTFLKNKTNKGRPIKQSYFNILQAIIKLLKSGMQWKYLTLDNLSYKTINRYFNLWSKKNIFSKYKC